MSIVKGLILLILFAYFIYKYITQININTKQREYFIKTLSHDFRVAILAQIRGLEYLKKNLNSNIYCDDLIFEIHKSCNYSLDMISMLMDTYNYENGKQVLTYNNFLIRNELNEIIEKYNFMLKEKNIQIKIDLPKQFYIEADKLAINKLISLLFITAINYSESNSLIQISLKKTKNCLKFSLFYKGKKLSEEECRRMFLKDPRFSTVGHGIRMHLCKKIVDFHNGKIWVKSRSKNINSFNFNLPIKRSTTSVKPFSCICLQELAKNLYYKNVKNLNTYLLKH